MKKKKWIIVILLLVWICCAAALIFRGCQNSARLNGYFITDESGQRIWCELPAIRYGKAQDWPGDPAPAKVIPLTEEETDALIDSWPNAVEHLGWEDYRLEISVIMHEQHEDPGETEGYVFTNLYIKGYDDAGRLIFRLTISPAGKNEQVNGPMVVHGKRNDLWGVDADAASYWDRLTLSFWTDKNTINFELPKDSGGADEKLAARVARYAIVEAGFDLSGFDLPDERIQQGEIRYWGWD